MAKRIKLSQKDIEKVVYSVINENLDLDEENPFVRQGGIPNIKEMEGFVLVKDQDGNVYAQDNLTGQILHKFG